MLLLFPCPGTISVPSCQLSCQMSCWAPPLSGCNAAGASHLSTAPMTAPMPACGGGPAPSPSGSGRGTRSSPSAASRPARKRMPHLAVCDATAIRRASDLAVPPPRTGSRLQTRLFLHLLLWCRQETVPEPFSYLARRFLHARVPAAPSQPPQTQYPSHQRVTLQRLDL
jgi:hypothetical protein